MVKQEIIDIEPYIFILLSTFEKTVKWMVCVNGVGSCGSSESKEKAINNILKSPRLTDKQKYLIKNDKNKNNNSQLELF